MAQSAPPPHKKSVFVTGANGYIGSAVCRAFVRAGWHVYGLVRRAEAAGALHAAEITPIIGSISKDATFLSDLHAHTKTLDVVVSCTEQFPFGAHHEALVFLLRQLAETSGARGVRPLVLASSGCKDYGTTGGHGDAGLAPHTEESPLNPPELVAERASSSLRIFEHADLFDAAVLRPTPVFGYDSSYYGLAFEIAAAAAAAARPEAKALALPSPMNTIVHGCHVDDCAEAYVALAEHGDRAAVAGQCFNISAARYDTLGSIAAALKAEYGLREVAEAPGDQDVDMSLWVTLGYSQWVDSTKIRKLTGWTDKRLLLSEDLHVYRMAYEEAGRQGHEGVRRIKERLASVMGRRKKA